MAATLKTAKELTFHAELALDDWIPGLLVQVAGAVDVALRRPNGLRVEYRDDLGARSIWYDGNKLTLFDWGAGVVATASAPSTVDATLAHFEERYAMTLPLAELLVGDPYASITARAVRGTYVGRHDVEGVPLFMIPMM